ncbi:uncharacterized protein LOC128590138 [Nycticebus coucang]|uniref:uncharacterized protein LOC128590138 n=1 Tax=Nycticebus coucang TaxID=9470 RepID=UPI00234E11D7|nr:uncharacterized protein LOC128590138 [Nycticebus coucang]
MPGPAWSQPPRSRVCERLRICTQCSDTRSYRITPPPLPVFPRDSLRRNLRVRPVLGPPRAAEIKRLLGSPNRTRPPRSGLWDRQSNRKDDEGLARLSPLLTVCLCGFLCVCVRCETPRSGPAPFTEKGRRALSPPLEHVATHFPSLNSRARPRRGAEPLPPSLYGKVLVPSSALPAPYPHPLGSPDATAMSVCLVPFWCQWSTLVP